MTLRRRSVPCWQEVHAAIGAHLAHDVTRPVEQASPHLASFVPPPIGGVGAEDQQQRQRHARLGDEGRARGVGGQGGEAVGQRVGLQGQLVGRQERRHAHDPADGGQGVLEDVGAAGAGRGRGRTGQQGRRGVRVVLWQRLGWSGGWWAVVAWIVGSRAGCCGGGKGGGRGTLGWVQSQCCGRVLVGRVS